MQRKKRLKLWWARHQHRWFGKWHLYLGIIAGFIIAIIGVTGSILVFQDDIDLALNKDYFLVQQEQHKIPLEAIVPMVKARYPALRFDYAMNEDDGPNRAYRFYDFATEKEFFINPYTAKMSGKRLYQSSFIRIVMNIHTSLLVPKIGEYITGTAALILLILTITGLRLWITKKWKQLKSVLTVNFKAGFKRQNYDWHNVIGFYTAPIVAFLSLTGLCISFSVIVIPALFMLSGQSPQGVAAVFNQKSLYSKKAIALAPKEIAAIAYQQMPHSRIGGIGLPTDSTGVYRLDMITPGLPKTGKREMLVFDQYSGKLLLNSRQAFPSAGKAYLSWLIPLHYGTFGGLPTQILALIGGLCPLLLFITGFIIWWPRWKRQKKNAVKDAAEGRPGPRRLLKIKTADTEKLTIGAYFWKHLKQGLRYALWTLLIIMVMGVLYGVLSGIVVQPAVFGIAYTTVFVIINFIIALVCFVFNVLFLAPFRKGKAILVKFFSLSFGFLIVFLFAYLLLMNTGMNIF
jgi:uncharacterized iron-regulated membrane protein